jgi:hypothetical protein
MLAELPDTPVVTITVSLGAVLIVTLVTVYLKWLSNKKKDDEDDR